MAKNVVGWIRVTINGRNAEAYIDPLEVTTVQAVKEDGPTILTVGPHEIVVNGGFEYWATLIALAKEMDKKGETLHVGELEEKANAKTEADTE